MKPKFTHGTAREHADQSSGFNANGESQFSRRASHPENVRMGRMHRNPKLRATDITCNEIELDRLKRALSVERKPERIAKLLRNIDAKTNFLARLKAERDDNRIETVYGSEEFDPWDKV